MRKKKVTAEILNSMIGWYDEGMIIGEIVELVESNYSITLNRKTVTEHLRRKIKLRSLSETIKIKFRRNLSIGEIIDDYTNKNLTVKQLSEKFQLCQNTIKSILVDNGVRLRDRGLVNHLFRTKYPKPKVMLSKIEKAYLSGLVIGDFAVNQKSKYVLRLSTSSTIKSFIEMTNQIFRKYGHVMNIYDKYNACFKVTVDLNFNSFKFLKDVKNDFRNLENISKEEFLHFLAGFVDAEGTLSISKRKKRNTIELGIQVYNTNLELLKMMQNKLSKLNFVTNILRIRKIGKNYYKGKIFNHNYEEHRLSLFRKYEIEKLLKLLPIKHPDKLIKKKLMLFCIRNKITRLDEYLKIEKTIL